MIKISKIVRKKSYYEVQTTDAIYEIDGGLLRQYDLQEGESFEADVLERLHQQSRFRRAYQRACYLLDDRDYSYCMLYQKLMFSYQDSKLCTDVMNRLVQYGAVDDRRYAEKYAEYLVQRKGYGIYRAKQEMLRKGLDKNLIHEFLTEQEAFALANLPVVLVRKYGSVLIDEQDFKARNKVIAGMTRLGYDYRAVRNAIEDYFAEQEEEE